MNLEERCEMLDNSLKEEKRIFDNALKRVIKPYQLPLCYNQTKSKIEKYETTLSRAYTLGMLTLKEYETLNAVLGVYYDYFVNETKRKEGEL